MSLALGTRVGAFEIGAQLGAGGMGEVYRATDTTLGRQVAIKVLPDAFAHDPDRLARFDAGGPRRFRRPASGTALRPFQSPHITDDQRLFLCSCPTLQLPFSGERMLTRVV
jgi:serine/threonine protein kinase